MRWRNCCFCPMRALAAKFEQLALAVDRGGDIRIADEPQQCPGEDHTVRGITLALEPGLARDEFVDALHDDRKVGPCDGVIEAHDDVARLDAVAIAHPQFADDAAGRVLNLLHVRIDDNRTWRDERP